jgi:hypothetical protein
LDASPKGRLFSKPTDLGAEVPMAFDNDGTN